MSKAKVIQELEETYKKTANMLRVYEKIWQEEWETTPNPFVAIKTWNHQNNVERRLAIINPYLKARDELNNAKDNA
jgi:hypothetical protein